MYCYKESTISRDAKVVTSKLNRPDRNECKEIDQEEIFELEKMNSFTCLQSYGKKYEIIRKGQSDESILMGMRITTYNSTRNRAKEESTVSDDRINTHNSTRNRTREESTVSDERINILVPACAELKKKAQSPRTTAAEHKLPNTSDILKGDTQVHMYQHSTVRNNPVESGSISSNISANVCHITPYH